MTFTQAIDLLSIKSVQDKTRFLKFFLFELTIMNRAILDDHTTSDKTKIICLKWSNELDHRLGNLLFEFERGKEKESVTKFANHLIFYQKQSKELSRHLTATFKSSIRRFNSI